MKYFYAALMFFCLSYGSGLSATPLFVENHGYVMGELNKVDLIGPNRRIVAGEVSIGNNSFSAGNDVRDELRGDYVLNNPWNFCGTQEFYEKLVAPIGEFVVIEYRTPKSSSLLQCQSRNEIVAVYPLSTGMVITGLLLFKSGTVGMIFATCRSSIQSYTRSRLTASARQPK